MRDQTSEAPPLKRRRVDIGVKRTAPSAPAPPAPADADSNAHPNAARPSRHVKVAASGGFHGAFFAMNRAAERQDPTDCPVADGNGNNNNEAKSDVLRKLLKRGSSYEGAVTTTFPGVAIISQLLKSNVAANGKGGGGGPPAIDAGSDGAALQDDVCSEPSSSSRGDSPQERLSPPFARSMAPGTGTGTGIGTGTGTGSAEPDRLSEEHLRAKRARVENIIRGMSHSPGVVMATTTTATMPASSSSSSCSSSSSSSLSGARNGVRDRDRDRDREAGAESFSARPTSPRENKRKQKLPQQSQSQSLQSSQSPQSSHAQSHAQSQERKQLRLQLEDMQKQLRQLQEKFFQVYDSTDSEGRDPDPDDDPDDDPGNPSDDSADDDVSDPDPDPDPGRFLDRARALLRGQASLPEQERVRVRPVRREVAGSGRGRDPARSEGRRLGEALKRELSSAVSQVVDAVVKVFAEPAGVGGGSRGLRGPPGGFGVNGGGDDPPDPPDLLRAADARLRCFGDVIIPSPLGSFGGVPLPSANDQTEALPLVVRKAPSEHHLHHHPQSSAVGTHGSQHHPALHPSSLSAGVGFTPPPSFRPPFALPLVGYPFQGPLGAAGCRGSPDSTDLRTKMAASAASAASAGGAGLHHVGGHHLRRACSPAHPGVTAESLSLALVKSECGDLQDVADISPYSAAGGTIQEGLSPNHLKKAKLMFFYTRYPSSNMLKMFFSDVKFNRCITSQLIKWFSNFREFYYIQMEKFARQAINDGVTTSDDLSVGRDSELYRALNMHYNKANDFEVPERFLEVAQVTLREFFGAIAAGKDVDPSWKKAIYKVICKLDSEVPEVFKSPHCLQELLHE